MLPPPSIELRDGTFYVDYKGFSPIMDPLNEFAGEIEDKYDMDLKWKYRKIIIRIVRRATDRGLKFWKTSDKEPCEGCRGWGYIRAPLTEVWNGSPFKVTKKHCTENIDWKSPAWCKKCKGNCA